MNIEQFNNSVNTLLSNLSNDLPIINARITRSGLSLIHNRILNDGIDGASYSTNPLPAYFFTGKSISAGGDARVKAKNKANKGKGISYVDFRDANNLQTNHVDLRLSGDMWRDADVTDNTQFGLKNTTIAEFKGSIKYQNGKTTAEIADYNASRYGDFLTPTKQEENILDEALDDELQQLIDTYFR